MRIHTIRWNGDKTHRIVTFTKAFEQELIKAHPQAIRVFISALLSQLKRMDGNTHTLDHAQQERLNQYLTQDLVASDGGWVDKVKMTPEQQRADSWVQNGMRLTAASLLDVLRCLDYIYSRLQPLDA